MFKSTRTLVTSLGLILCGITGPAWLIAQAPPADNTKTNARDRQPSQVTADQQATKSSDVEITRQIRKAIVADSTLSTYGHNVKVITQKGKVTLKGPVRTTDEKAKIEAFAVGVAGATNVVNALSVVPKPASGKS